MSLLKRISIGVLGILLAITDAQAQVSTIWGAPHAALSATNRIPVDTSALGGPGYNSIGDILNLINGDCTVNINSGQITCTKANGASFAAVATSGSAADLITGTLAAARLPLPTASTPGGVQAITAAGSKWINSIGLDGVPTQTQPQDADILFTDTVTGNVSTLKHGYAPKLSGTAFTFLDGTGHYTSPSAFTAISFAGDGVVLSSTPSSGPIMSATLATAAADSLLGNSTGSSATPTYTTSPVVAGSMTANTLVSTVATGTAPLTVTSTTPVTNLSIGGNAATATALSGALSANTVLGALTAVAPTGLAVPSCSTTASALKWTSGTGFGCNTAIAAPAASITGTTLASNVVTTSVTTVGALASGSLTTGFTTVAAAQGGTGQTSIASAFASFFESVATTLGDIVYGGASGAPARLAGNTTTTTDFLVQTGNGTVSAAPAWTAPASLTPAFIGSSITALNGSNVSSGTVVAARLPTGTVISATASPAQGDILYYNGTNWTDLAPGTSGNFLKTQGSSANPIWAAVSGSGTVTSVATTAPITGGTFTTSGTIACATCVASASTWAQGDILYYNGSNWVDLAAGTSGQFLKTQGTSANPVWATNSNTGGGFVNAFRNGTFLVYQRGANITATTGSDAYAYDGWEYHVTGANEPWGLSTTGASTFVNPINGTRYNNYILIQGATSNTASSIYQKIEGNDAAQLAGRVVTVQFLLENNTGSTITPTVNTCYAASIDNFSTCTADLSATNLQSCTNNSLCLEAYNFTPSASAVNGYEVEFNFGALTAIGNTVSITAFDIRANTSATNNALNSNPPTAEFPNYQAELQRSQRYFVTSYGNGVVPGSASSNFVIGSMVNATTIEFSAASIYFPTQMRTSPSMLYWDSAGTANKTSKVNDSTGAVTNAGPALSYLISTPGSAYFSCPIAIDAASSAILFSASAEQ